MVSLWGSPHRTGATLERREEAEGVTAACPLARPVPLVAEGLGTLRPRQALGFLRLKTNIKLASAVIAPAIHRR